MTIEEIEEEYCSKCIHNGYCYIPCPQVTSRQLEDALEVRSQATNNAELFKQTFGIYATEIWSMSESQFCKNREVKFSKHCPECGARLKGDES